MNTLKKLSVSDIDIVLPELLETKIVLIGEIHGVKENIFVIETLLKKLLLLDTRPIIIAFEWPLHSDDVAMLNAYIHSSASEFPHNVFFIDSDNRFTKEHITFFKNIRNNSFSNRITLKCFDDTTYSINREKVMSDSLLKIHKESPEALIIAETGVIHAAKKECVDFDGKLSIPMGLYLEDEINIKSIFLRYLKGSIIVEGTEYAITDAASQQDGTEKSFDFEFVINESHPAENISNLTEIQVLLES